MMGRRRHSQRDLRDLDGTGIEHLTAISIYPATEPCVWWSGSGSGQPPNIVQEAIDGKANDLPWSMYTSPSAGFRWCSRTESHFARPL